MDTKTDKHWSQRQASSESLGQPSWFWPQADSDAAESKKQPPAADPCVWPIADARFHRIIAHLTRKSSAPHSAGN